MIAASTTVAEVNGRGEMEAGASPRGVGTKATGVEKDDGDAVDDEEEGEAAPASGLRRR